MRGFLCVIALLCALMFGASEAQACGNGGFGYGGGYGFGGYGGYAGASYGYAAPICPTAAYPVSFAPQYPQFSYGVPSYGYGNNVFVFNRFRRGFNAYNGFNGFNRFGRR